MNTKDNAANSQTKTRLAKLAVTLPVGFVAAFDWVVDDEDESAIAKLSLKAVPPLGRYLISWHMLGVDGVQRTFGCQSLTLDEEYFAGCTDPRDNRLTTFLAHMFRDQHLEIHLQIEAVTPENEDLAKGIDAVHTGKNGKRHRLDGPAVSYGAFSYRQGGYEYWVEGTQHRDGGPAVYWPLVGEKGSNAGEDPRQGLTKYYRNGLPHRSDGPAIVYANGDQEYYVDGQLHRENGPAVILSGGTKEWYLNGKKHRVGGPAVEYRDGSFEYFEDGELHREDGPALVVLGRTMEWFVKGRRHRDDGPAWEGRENLWYLDGGKLDAPLPDAVFAKYRKRTGKGLEELKSDLDPCLRRSAERALAAADVRS